MNTTNMQLKAIVSEITNVHFEKESQPVKFGGLGIRRAEKLHPLLISLHLLLLPALLALLCSLG